jgi:glycosyltransferase involved in cell wall biosynthesis
VERVADLLAARLEARGDQVEWLTPAQLSPAPRSRRYPGVNEALRAFWLARALRRQPPVDLTLSHGMLGFGARGRHLHVYHGTFAGLATACRAGLHRLDYLVLRWLNGMLERQSGCGATRIAVSRSVAREIRTFYGLTAQHQIPNGVDVTHFTPVPDRPAQRARWGLSPEHRWVLVVGRLDYGKGRDVLRALLSRLPEQVRLVLAAPSASGLEQLAPERVIRIPGVSYQDLPSLYAASDVLLCPSLYEGFGLTLIEAWACEVPVVSGTVGVAEELREHPSLGTAFVATADASALAETVTRVLETPGEAARQAAAGRAQVLASYSLDAFALQYLQLMDAMVASGP